MSSAGRTCELKRSALSIVAFVLLRGGGRMSRVARGISGVVCVYSLFALAGCGGATEHGGTTESGGTAGHSTPASVVIKSKNDNPAVAVCMQRDGVTVLSNGELRVSRTVTAAKRKAIEKRCGFGAAKAALSSRSAARKRLAKPHQSFRNRLVAKLVACLRRAGVSIPPSDPDPLSSTSGIKTRSLQVKTAIGKCRSESLSSASR